MDTTVIYWVYNGIMENKMETTIIFWGYIVIMEKKMETTYSLRSFILYAGNISSGRPFNKL